MGEIPRMVKEKTRREKRVSVYEFQSLSPENGFRFICERDEKELKRRLSSTQIFMIHEAKFLIWERFGLVNVYLGIPYIKDDIVSISHELSIEKIDDNFDLENFLYFVIPKGIING
jgi:hypothetical protein